MSRATKLRATSRSDLFPGNGSSTRSGGSTVPEELRQLMVVKGLSGDLRDRLEELDLLLPVMRELAGGVEGLGRRGRRSGRSVLAFLLGAAVTVAGTLAALVPADARFWLAVRLLESVP